MIRSFKLSMLAIFVAIFTFGIVDATFANPIDDQPPASVVENFHDAIKKNIQEKDYSYAKVNRDLYVTIFGTENTIFFSEMARIAAIENDMQTASSYITKAGNTKEVFSLKYDIAFQQIRYDSTAQQLTLSGIVNVLNEWRAKADTNCVDFSNAKNRVKYYGTTNHNLGVLRDRTAEFNTELEGSLQQINSDKQNLFGLEKAYFSNYSNGRSSKSSNESLLIAGQTLMGNGSCEKAAMIFQFLIENGEATNSDVLSKYALVVGDFKYNNLDKSFLWSALKSLPEDDESNMLILNNQMQNYISDLDVMCDTIITAESDTIYDFYIKNGEAAFALYDYFVYLEAKNLWDSEEFDKLSKCLSPYLVIQKEIDELVKLISGANPDISMREKIRKQRQKLLSTIFTKKKDADDEKKRYFSDYDSKCNAPGGMANLLLSSDNTAKTGLKKQEQEFITYTAGLLTSENK